MAAAVAAGRLGLSGGSRCRRDVPRCASCMCCDEKSNHGEVAVRVAERSRHMAGVCHVGGCGHCRCAQVYCDFLAWRFAGISSLLMCQTAYGWGVSPLRFHCDVVGGNTSDPLTPLLVLLAAWQQRAHRSWQLGCSSVGVVSKAATPRAPDATEQVLGLKPNLRSLLQLPDWASECVERAGAVKHQPIRLVGRALGAP